MPSSKQHTQPEADPSTILPSDIRRSAAGRLAVRAIFNKIVEQDALIWSKAPCFDRTTLPCAIKNHKEYSLKCRGLRTSNIGILKNEMPSAMATECMLT